MKKIFLLLALSLNIVLANDNYELQLYEAILPSIFSDTPIKIYGDREIRAVLQNSTKFTFSQKCDSSVLLIIGRNFKKLSPECQNKPVFSTSYKWSKHHKNSIGSFYWRKGRPQLRFKKSGFKLFNLKLPYKLIKYAK